MKDFPIGAFLGLQHTHNLGFGMRPQPRGFWRDAIYTARIIQLLKSRSLRRKSYPPIRRISQNLTSNPTLTPLRLLIQ